MRRRTSVAANAQHWLLVAAVSGAALLYGPQGGVDGITVTKGTVVVVAGLVALAVGAWTAVHSAVITLPRAPAITAAGILAVLLVARVVVSEEPVRAIVGAFGRWNGMALYLACLVLFVVAAARGQDLGARRLIRAFVVTGVVVALYALDEAFLGLGPTWAERPGTAATLGNANFLAAWAGCVFGAALAVSLDGAETRAWRRTGAASAVLLLVAVVLAGSFQGGYVLAAVLAVLALAWAADRVSRRSFQALSAGAGLAAVVGAALTVLGALGRGPASFLGTSVGVQLRAEYWAAAGRMTADHPLLGVGPGRFADHYREHRSVEAAQLVPLASSADSAHNVPLHLLAEWGPLVALAYLAVVILVTVAMVRELARREGAARMRYAGLSAVWVGYVLQSTISIDTPALAVLGWVAAGLVLAPQVSSAWRWKLPWPASRRSKRAGTPMPARLVHGGVGLVALAALWAVLLPWRADVASTGGELEVGSGSEAGPPISTGATDLAPWEDRYLLQVATVLSEQGEREMAADTVHYAYTIAPHRFEIAVNAARVAAADGEADVARERYERALELEPIHPDLAVEVAEFAREHGEESWARQLVERALAVDPDHAEALALQEQL